MDNSDNSRGFEKKFISFIGKIGLFLSLLLSPPIFMRLFAVSPLIFDEPALLWYACTTLFVVSLALIFSSGKIRASYGFPFFVTFLLIIIELTTRSYVVLFSPLEERKELGKYANKTYDAFAKFIGHPYTVYSGNPSKSYMDGEEEKKTSVFNKMGFVGQNFSHNKSKDKIRIACLGGSTTERGYPDVTEYMLNKHFNDSLEFEVYNFGVSGWTSANTLVNFVLNVRDFNPDYVLIHQGWNDARVRNTPKKLFRNDYSHAFKHFQEPKIFDKALIRTSLIYRILKRSYSNNPDWMYLGNATIHMNRPQTTLDYENLKELIPFKRNIKTIIDLCLKDSIKVVLSTQPFSLVKYDGTSKAIQQTNEVYRNLILEYPSCLFLDLDQSTTGNFNSLFTDLAHMNNFGIFYKGSEFARVIVNDIKKDSLSPMFPYEINPISYHTLVKITKQNQDRWKTLCENAKKNNFTTHQMMKKEAMNAFLKRNPHQNKSLNQTFEYLYQEHRIRKNSAWILSIEKKAKEKGLSLEECLKEQVEALLSSNTNSSH